MQQFQAMHPFILTSDQTLALKFKRYNHKTLLLGQADSIPMNNMAIKPSSVLFMAEQPSVFTSILTTEDSKHI